MCHDPVVLFHVGTHTFVGLTLIVADDTAAYMFAGVFTVIAALVVVIVMLATSESKEDENL